MHPSDHTVSFSYGKDSLGYKAILVITAMRKLLISSIFLFMWLPLMAGVIVPKHGDLVQDGQITNADVSALVEMVLQKQQASHWIIQNGSVTASAAVSGDSDLCGDLNHDGNLSVSDIVLMMRLIDNPDDLEYVVVKDGKVSYAKKGVINFDPEDGGFIDDGEIEF